MQPLKVVWLSAGVSSFVAGYLAQGVDKFIYIDIEEQHPDSMRFIKDIETVLNQPVTILRSRYGSVENAIKAGNCIVNGFTGWATCTNYLKKRVRKDWEYLYRDFDITYVWGFDLDEKDRADRLVNSMPQFNHEFPLIDYGLTKQDAHGICEKLGIKRPLMYDLGYNNNNCVGCVKGGMGYWNKIRIDFPSTFERMAKLERIVGYSCIKGVFLDELSPDRGRMTDEVMQDCSIACEIALNS